MALPLLTMLLLQCDFASWLPAAALLRLLAVRRLEPSVLTNLQFVRALSSTFNELVDASSAALLAGVYCPGLDGRVPGTLMLERSVAGLFFNDVLDRLGFVPGDERDLGPVVQRLVPGPSGHIFAAWCCINEPTPVWLSLQLFLQSIDPQNRFSYHWLQRPTHTAFVVVLRIGSLRAALVFEATPIVITDSD